MEQLIEKNYFLHNAARDAYRSYLHAYSSHSLKDIYNVNSLNLLEVCKSFGFSIPPKVNLHVQASKKDRPRKSGFLGDSKDSAIKKRLGTGHSFSARNPHGKREAGDKRSFARI